MNLLLTGIIVGLTVPLLSEAKTVCLGNEQCWLTRDPGASSGCTVFTISKGDQVFFGGNDDYINSDSYYWVDSGGDGNYGAIWIGEPDNVQQGVNERGLAYDANGLPRIDVNPHSERIPVAGRYTSYPVYILRECATVEEVITWAKTHEWHSYMHDQMHFADATGDAVIISAGADEEVVFTRKPSGDGFLVSTNFNVANPDNSVSYPCWRYDRVQGMLEQLVKQGRPLTYRDATRVLDAVHVEAVSGWTIESMVADLVKGKVYLYYFYQYDQPVVLNVREEIANTGTAGPLSELFPRKVQEKAALRYQEIEAKKKRCDLAGMSWLTAVLISLIVLILLSHRNQHGVRLWLPAVSILGPIALIIRVTTSREPGLSPMRKALIEAAGDVMPLLISIILFLALVIFVPAVQSSWYLQFVLLVGLPPLVALLIFHGPILAPMTKNSYRNFLSQRLPQVLVTANLGTGGIAAVVMPLVALSIRTCSVFPLTFWTLIIWWGMAAAGAVVGGFILFLFETWSVKRRFQAWSIVTDRNGEIHTPSWGDLRWWLLLSYVVLLGGLFVGAILNQVLVA